MNRQPRYPDVRMAPESGSGRVEKDDSPAFASQHPSVLKATEFQRANLASDVIAAHEAVLQEFAMGGAAQLLKEGAWFYLDEAAVARSIDTVGIVAVLIATMGFTGFLQPPGGWENTSVWKNRASAAPVTSTAEPSLAPALAAFIFGSTLAMAASMSLVLVIAVGSSFGLKARGMLWVLYSGFGLLALAVVAAFVAVGAASFYVNINHAARVFVITILLAVALLTAIVLVSLVVRVRRRARKDAYKQRLEVLYLVASHMMDALRTLNNSYLPYEGKIIGDPILARYFHQYTITMLGTLAPLFYYFVVETAELSGISKRQVEKLARLQGLRHFDTAFDLNSDSAQSGLLDYWMLWCKKCPGKEDMPGQFETEDGQDWWDVGIDAVEYEEQRPPPRLCVTRADLMFPRITGGMWPNVKCVSDDLRNVDDAAKNLVQELLKRSDCGDKLPKTVAEYRRQVKTIFNTANLSPMMPPIIRIARLGRLEVQCRDPLPRRHPPLWRALGC